MLKQKYWHELFETGVALKAINSVWEVVSGLLLLTAAHTWLTGFLVHLSTVEVLGDRHDSFFQFLSGQLLQLSVSTRTFIGMYLLFHGLLNIFFVASLYANRIWAYPISIIFTSFFLAYMAYRLVHHPSHMLLAFIVFDALFVLLTWHEYRYQLTKASHATP